MNVADPVSSGKYSGTCVSVPPVRTSVGAKRLVFLCGGQAMEVKHDETNGLSMCVPLFFNFNGVEFCLSWRGFVKGWVTRHSACWVSVAGPV